jgi:hypothetical protein
MTEFNLSEKIKEEYIEGDVTYLEVDDVKEFIRLLKEVIPNFVDESYPKGLHFEIDKLAGEKLQ